MRENSINEAFQTISFEDYLAPTDFDTKRVLILMSNIGLPPKLFKKRSNIFTAAPYQ